MVDNRFLEESAEHDPTWALARSIAQRRLRVPNNLLHLVRNGWSGDVQPIDLVKMIGFTGLNPNCLLNAAGMPTESRAPRVAELEKAIASLGVRYSTVIMAINASVRAILKTKPSVGWRKLLEGMMDDVQIGYCFGSRASELGPEGGVLVAFARSLGPGLLLAHDLSAYKKYQELQRRSARVSSHECIALFGCEPYQVSAMAVQRLGFGVDAAIAAACGLSNLRLEYIQLSDAAQRWRAAFHWIDALKEGRDYPADVDLRNAFNALRPPPDRKIKNPVLEMLYVEVIRVRREGSSWTWHLPGLDYERTREAFGL